MFDRVGVVSNYNIGLIWGSSCCSLLTSIRSRVRVGRFCIKLQCNTDLGKLLLLITDFSKVAR